jgi:ABC-type antimicrobial peptide transport system permease subunit
MIWSVVRLRRRRDVIPSGRHFLLFWIGPVLLFQLLIHVTEVGHALWYLPPAYAVLALGASTLGAQRVALLPAAAVFASLAQFYFYPWRAEVSGRQRILNAKVAFVSAQGLARIDQRPEMHEPGDFWPVPSAPLSDSR